MRKILCLLFSMFLLISSSILIDQFQENNFTVFNSVNPLHAEKIKIHLKEVEELEFSALLCNETRVPFDDTTNTFYVPLDMDTKQWEKLEFISGQPEYQILFIEDVTLYQKSEVIAGGNRFEIIVFDSRCWSEYYVTFTGLPIIDLATSEGVYGSEEIAGTASFFDTDFSLRGISKSEYDGHVRGNTSRMFPKKGYKLNLKETNASGEQIINKLPLFGMRKDDDWILYAIYNDDTKIRDRLSMEVWDTFGAREVSENSYYGPKMTYVELFCNNVYCGLYGLMEPVDDKQLNLAEEDYSYKRKNPGGLMNKFDVFYEEEDAYAEMEGFVIKEGSREEGAELWKPLAELSATLSMPDEQFAASYTKIMDSESVLRMWLFLQIITGHDHTAKNMFYVAKYEEDGFRFYFAPWDMDLTWGNVSVGEANPLYTAFEEETVENRVSWETADRLLELDCNDSRAYVQELYSNLRNTVLTDQEITKIVQNLDSEIRSSGAYERDRVRWPDGAHTNSCDRLLSYAKERLRFLDQAICDDDFFE